MKIIKWILRRFVFRVIFGQYQWYRKFVEGIWCEEYEDMIGYQTYWVPENKTIKRYQTGQFENWNKPIDI